MNLYEMDLEQESGAKDGKSLQLHDFRFVRGIRRMICKHCLEPMNECPAECKPKRGLQS